MDSLSGELADHWWNLRRKGPLMRIIGVIFTALPEQAIEPSNWCVDDQKRLNVHVVVIHRNSSIVSPGYNGAWKHNKLQIRGATDINQLRLKQVQ